MGKHLDTWGNAKKAFTAKTGSPKPGTKWIFGLWGRWRAALDAALKVVETAEAGLEDPLSNEAVEAFAKAVAKFTSAKDTYIKTLESAISTEHQKVVTENKKKVKQKEDEIKKAKKDPKKKVDVLEDELEKAQEE